MSANQELTPLEQAVIEKFLDRDDPAVAGLRSQIAAATVTKREFTGVGFFTFLSVPPNRSDKIDNRSFQWTDVGAEIPGLENGAGFVLFVGNGTVNLLEGYTYGDEAWPQQIPSFRVKRI